MWSRSLLLLLAVALLLACAVDDAPASRLPDQASMSEELEVIARGAYGLIAQGEVEGTPLDGNPFVELARNTEEMSELWNRYIAESPPPAVDFEDRVVVFLLMPLRSSGGYSIRPASASTAGSELVIDAEVVEPDRGMMTTQALTSPYSVLSVSTSSKIESVRWIDGERTVSEKKALR